ncbi:MAG: polysaccharide export protein [Pedobacter sp.]|nr:MAG: polysaccharide export protein [Pedobacter sp.]
MLKKLYLLLFVALISSCGVKYETVPYFTDLPAGEDVEENIMNKSVIKIQKDDVLSIIATSPNAEANAIFNTANATSIGSGQSAGAAVNGFLVDNNGNVNVPYLGAVKVEGLTTSEARDKIEKALNVEGGFLKNAVVSLRIANFKVSVLGDVLRPGVFPVQNERISILDALSLAGDLNITALRDNVLLIRETDGKREQVRVNLQQKDLLNSPYFYLKTNDVIYVQPGKNKYASVDSSYRNTSIVLSAISVVVLALTRIF